MAMHYSPTSIRLPTVVMKRIDRLRSVLALEEGVISRSAMINRVILTGLHRLERRHVYGRTPPLPDQDSVEASEGASIEVTTAPVHPHQDPA